MASLYAVVHKADDDLLFMHCSGDYRISNKVRLKKQHFVIRRIYCIRFLSLCSATICLTLVGGLIFHTWGRILQKTSVPPKRRQHFRGSGPWLQKQAFFFAPERVSYGNFSLYHAFCDGSRRNAFLAGIKMCPHLMYEPLVPKLRSLFPLHLSANLVMHAIWVRSE